MPERLKAAKDEVTAMIQRSVIPKWGTFIFLVPAPGQWDTSVWYLTSCRRLQRLTHPGVGTGKQQKESLTGEQEICVLSVATVMDLGYPVAIYSHVAPNSSTRQQPVRELCLFRAPCWHMYWWDFRNRWIAKDPGMHLSGGERWQLLVFEMFPHFLQKKWKMFSHFLFNFQLSPDSSIGSLVTTYYTRHLWKTQP